MADLSRGFKAREKMWLTFPQANLKKKCTGYDL